MIPKEMDAAEIQRKIDQKSIEIAMISQMIQSERQTHWYADIRKLSQEVIALRRALERIPPRT